MVSGRPPGRVSLGQNFLADPNLLEAIVREAGLSPDDVAGVKDSPLSIMPEGQLDALTREQVRDLVGYLASKTQVPLPDAK